MAGEFDIIDKYFRPLAGPEGLGLKDDAARLTVPSGTELIVTKDLLVEGVHFFGDEPPALIAHKALAVNLSDLAAKGAKPFNFFLGLALPSPLNETWIREFSVGLEKMQRAFEITLAGGDTTASSCGVMISITALGTTPIGGMVRRSGAKAGDRVFVSGTLGDAALGLRCVQGQLEAEDYLINRYREPTPRMKLGAALRGVASACADISDGLLADLGHICSASQVGAKVELAQIPVSEPAKRLITENQNLMPSVYSGGDDYELVFTVPQKQQEKIPEIAQKIGIALTDVGEVVAGDGCYLVDRAGQMVQTASQGYQHF